MSDRSDSPSENPENAPEEIEALAASDAANVMDSFDRNRTKILIGFALVAILICGILVSGQLKKQKHLAAGSAYSSALSKKEVAAFDAVAVDFPGTIAAGNAMLSKAELQIDQGKPEDARATLETFTSDFPKHPRHAQGLFALGNLYHTSGDAAKAKDYYQQCIDEQPDGELTPLARIRLGDLALEAGDKEAADQRYQESYTLHPGNRFVEYAEEKIALLKIGNPPKVKRPEPPQPEPAPEAEPKAEAAKPGPAGAPANEKGKAPAKGKQPAPEGKGKAAPKGNPKAPGKAKAPAEGKAKSAPKGPGKANAPAQPKSAPKTEAPKAAAPKAPAAPKSDAPKADAPKAPAAPKADAPKAPATPKADAPKAPAN
jgi:TolA-binding protein